MDVAELVARKADVVSGIEVPGPLTHNASAPANIAPTRRPARRFGTAISMRLRPAGSKPGS
jgi:hypothetical protein